MVERHYGAEMVDLLADPLLSGVYGGEATQLSVRAVLPASPTWKPNTAASAAHALRPPKNGLAAKTPARPLFSSLKDGMQQMVDALVGRLDAKITETSAPVQSVIVRITAGRFGGYQTDHFDAVIIATPRSRCGRVEAADENLARNLSDINYSSS